MCTKSDLLSFVFVWRYSELWVCPQRWVFPQKVGNNPSGRNPDASPAQTTGKAISFSSPLKRVLFLVAAHWDFCAGQLAPTVSVLRLP